jgi:hypothetical protein
VVRGVALTDEAIILGEEMLVHPELMALSCSTLKPFRSFSDPGREPRNLVEGKANKRALHDLQNFAADTRRYEPLRRTPVWIRFQG